MDSLYCSQKCKCEMCVYVFATTVLINFNNKHINVLYKNFKQSCDIESNLFDFIFSGIIERSPEKL